MSRPAKPRPADQEAVRQEQQALEEARSEPGTAAKPSQAEPCPTCHLRLVCRMQGLACADRLAHLLGQPLKGRRQPRLVIGLQVRELLADGDERD